MTVGFKTSGPILGGKRHATLRKKHRQNGGLGLVTPTSLVTSPPFYRDVLSLPHRFSGSCVSGVVLGRRRSPQTGHRMNHTHGQQIVGQPSERYPADSNDIMISKCYLDIKAFLEGYSRESLTRGDGTKVPNWYHGTTTGWSGTSHVEVDG